MPILTKIILFLGETLVIAGAVGLAAMTFLFPLLGAVAQMVTKGLRTAKQKEFLSGPTLRIAALVPAKNEGHQIGRTLVSIRTAAEIANLDLEKSGIPWRLDVRTIVGADGCTDRTAPIARSFPGTEVREHSPSLGKWDTISRLVRSFALHGSPSGSPNWAPHWIALADSGSMWSADLLRSLTSDLFSGTAVGIAPGYFPSDASRLENVSWTIERSLKTLENLAGGPVSVHGASVFYRAEALQAALNELTRVSSTPWLNDDVAIPMMIRTLYPANPIVYRANARVHDRVAFVPRGAQVLPPREGVRRRRMLAGNLQWIEHLLPLAARANKAALIVSQRRVARLLWLWWLLSATLGSVLTVLAFELAEILIHPQSLSGPAALALTIATVTGVILFLSRETRNKVLKPRLQEIFWVALQTPAWVLSPRGRSEALWK